MTVNGSHVTRAELDAHLLPMREDISEIRDDVKTLLRSDAKHEGMAVEQIAWMHSRRWAIGITVGSFTGLIGSIATIAYLFAGVIFY